MQSFYKILILLLVLSVIAPFIVTYEDGRHTMTLDKVSIPEMKFTDVGFVFKEFERLTQPPARSENTDTTEALATSTEH